MEEEKGTLFLRGNIGGMGTSRLASLSQSLKIESVVSLWFNRKCHLHARKDRVRFHLYHRGPTIGISVSHLQKKECSGNWEGKNKVFEHTLSMKHKSDIERGWGWTSLRPKSK